MAVKPKTRTLPIVPLPHSSVLLPGVTLRIPLANRADIAAILAHIYSKASTPQPSAQSITIGCVPLNSPFLSPDGQKLIDNGPDSKKNKKLSYETDPGQAKKEDLFNYGTLARVSGVQGRREGQLALVIEGVQRFRVDKITQERPYFQGKIVMHEDEGGFIPYTHVRSPRS